MLSNIISNRVIVEGSVLHKPLNEGSILWVTETRLPLGPESYYVVRYNTEEDVPAGIRVAMAISFVGEFASQIFNDKELYKKGYDASGDNDEEVDNEVEFSDDEKELEYKKSQREGKRAINHSKGLKQEARFERKRNAFMGPRAQHKTCKDKQLLHNYQRINHILQVWRHRSLHHYALEHGRRVLQMPIQYHPPQCHNFRRLYKQSIFSAIHLRSY
ncbi:hypothetical protein IEQ34_002309 [Dendrobium chrysotoxum]|uniref:Uncharacterized protein n=1 Tax=Dendrobium chrysotoxum TaxID=161865 RepID=A0AAV7HJJ3_DENCH|nr:hypothetical protein IEQ34_002309 [Dendrobium chrysotoxum]